MLAYFEKLKEMKPYLPILPKISLNDLSVVTYILKGNENMDDHQFIRMYGNNFRSLTEISWRAFREFVYVF